MLLFIPLLPILVDQCADNRHDRSVLMLFLKFKNFLLQEKILLISEFYSSLFHVILHSSCFNYVLTILIHIAINIYYYNAVVNRLNHGFDQNAEHKYALGLGGQFASMKVKCYHPTGEQRRRPTCTSTVDLRKSK